MFSKSTTWLKILPSPISCKPLYKYAREKECGAKSTAWRTRVHLVCLLRGGNWQGEGKVEKSLWLADHIVRVFTPHLIVIGQCTMHTVHLAVMCMCIMHCYAMCTLHQVVVFALCSWLVACAATLLFLQPYSGCWHSSTFCRGLKTEAKKHTTGFVTARLLGYWDIFKMRYFSKISPHWANQCKIWLYEMENSKQITNMQFINWH